MCRYRRALELLALLPDSGEAPLFGISTSSLDALFRKARERSCIEGLTFHDSWHAAITRLAKKLNVLDLARMVGHRDLRMLCSGQPIPDTILSFSSTTAGASPWLN